MAIEDTLTPKLQKMAEEYPKVAKSAVLEASENAIELIKAGTPKSGRTFAERQRVRADRKQYHRTSLAESVVNSGYRGLAEFQPNMVQGYDKMTGWQWRFSDYGTEHQKAQQYTDKIRGKVAKDTKEIFEKHVSEVNNL